MFDRDSRSRGSLSTIRAWISSSVAGGDGPSAPSARVAASRGTGDAGGNTLKRYALISSALLGTSLSLTGGKSGAKADGAAPTTPDRPATERHPLEMAARRAACVRLSTDDT